MKLIFNLSLLAVIALSLLSIYTFHSHQGNLLVLLTDSRKSTFDENVPREKPKSKSRIAIISSFVGGAQSGRINLAEHETNLLLNKACYSKLWGYDFIFNTTYGFDKQKDEIEGGAWWLEYGTWNRVPHIRDRIREYDWILYADIDFIINDMSRPIESFFKEWELYNKHPSVFIPKDFFDLSKAFSAFAVLIKNDKFGWRVLENWMAAAKGLCPKGNFAAEKRPYDWMDSGKIIVWPIISYVHAFRFFVLALIFSFSMDRPAWFVVCFNSDIQGIFSK